MLLGLALVFGSAFFLVKLALGSYGPLTVALTRVALGCLILGTVAVWRGGALPRGPRIWLALLVMGALNNAIPFALISWGQTHIESGLAAILNAMTPIFTVLAAHAAGQERLSLRRLAGVALGFLGVAVLIGPASLRQAMNNLAEPVIRNFTENLMSYALGRRIEYYDGPTVRAIVRKAAQNDYRFSSFVVGIVNSAAFQMSKADPVVTTAEAEKDK